MELNVNLGNALLANIAAYDDHFAYTRAKHCFNELKINLDDPRWSSEAFVDAIPKLEHASNKTMKDAHKIYLSFLLEELKARASIPANLMRELIIYYQWPSSLSELNKADDLDPLIKQVLIQYANEHQLEDDLVSDNYRNKVRTRNLTFMVIAGIGLLLFLAFKVISRIYF